MPSCIKARARAYVNGGWRALGDTATHRPQHLRSFLSATACYFVLRRAFTVALGTRGISLTGASCFCSLHASRTSTTIANIPQLVRAVTAPTLAVASPTPSVCHALTPIDSVNNRIATHSLVTNAYLATRALAQHLYLTACYCHHNNRHRRLSLLSVS